MCKAPAVLGYSSVHDMNMIDIKEVFNVYTQSNVVNKGSIVNILTG